MWAHLNIQTKCCDLSSVVCQALTASPQLLMGVTAACDVKQPQPRAFKANQISFVSENVLSILIEHLTLLINSTLHKGDLF